MSPQGIDSLVMGTVNAPWKRTLAAGQLATIVKTANMESWLPHVATFFTEVKPHLLLNFAKLHDISASALGASYAKVKELTGESNELLESQTVLAQGRAAKVAVIDQLLSAFPDLGRTRLIQSLHDLERAGLAERLDGDAWLFPHQGKPRLSFSRTWSKPDGVTPDVEISATLANPRLADLAELCLAYSERRVRMNLDVLIEEDALRPPMIARLGSMLNNIHAGFIAAARRRYERSLSGRAS